MFLTGELSKAEIRASLSCKSSTHFKAEIPVIASILLIPAAEELSEIILNKPISPVKDI